MSIRTRQPTGLPSWPILLVAGSEKSGKSYACAVASGSELVGRTFWISIGEDDPDEYGAVEGARFEIVEHDGTYRQTLDAVRQAVAEPPVDGKPNLIVLDSASRLWALLSDEAQATANARAAKKGRSVGVDGADITMDLWNVAKSRWGHILDALRNHNGPVIVTARLSEVNVVENGQPTKDKTWKVEAEKNLPYDVGAVVQLRGYGNPFLTAVRSLRFKPTPAEVTALPSDWSIDNLWRQLGLEGLVGDRRHSGTQTQTPDAERTALLLELADAADKAGIPRADIAAQWESDYDEPLSTATNLNALALLRDEIRATALDNIAKEATNDDAR